MNGKYSARAARANLPAALFTTIGATTALDRIETLEAADIRSVHLCTADETFRR